MDDRDRRLLQRARIALDHQASGGPAWRQDQKTVDAVAKRIEEVGEALSRIPRPVRAEIPDIEWGAAIGMRAHLVHEYANVDMDFVEVTLRDDIPALIRAIEAALR